MASYNVNPYAVAKLPTWSHPEYQYWYEDWCRIRDTIRGQRQIKAKGKTYLPQPDGLDDTEYKAYLSRAVFYNMVAKTANALTGTLFRRTPSIENFPKKLKEQAENFTRHSQNIELAAKETVLEIVSVGRYGILLDREQTGDAFVTSYLAENIIDWTESVVNGRMVPTEIVLREHRINRDIRQVGYLGPKTILESFRVLSLEEQEDGSHIYVQYLYEEEGRNADILADDPTTIIPTNRGRPFNFIPFMAFNPFSNTLSIEKPPLNDIVDINLSHYQSYAHLEHGRWFTGIPIYYVPVSDNATEDDATDYSIGAAKVWEVAQGSKPGILEFFGSGLRFLENALDQKEQQASNLGGRMLGNRASATAETDNQVALTARNEQSLLLNVADVVDRGFTQLLRWWAEWSDISPEEAKKINFSVSKEFMLSIGARELRAVQAMYKDGLIPLEVLYEYLRKAEVVPDHMSMEEFEKLLMTPTSFPNQPDAEARAEGFPDKKTQLKTKADADKVNASLKQVVQSPPPVTQDQGGSDA